MNKSGRKEHRRNSLRQDITRLIQISTDYASRWVKNKVQKAYPNYLIPNETPIVEILNTLKQKLSVVCSRLRWYGESHCRHAHNATDAWNQIRSFNESQQSVQTVQFSVTDTKEYRGGFWGLPTQHADHAKWIAEKMPTHAGYEFCGR